MTNQTSATKLSANDLEFCAGGEHVLRDSAPPAAATDTAKEYVTFVKDLLEMEEKRGTGMEARALTVITSSGTLVTLLLALAALATRLSQFRVPSLALLLASLATVMFVVAAALAILVNAPWRVWGLRPDCLREELWERWDNPADDPQAKVTATRLALWSSAHRLTQRKARLIFAATGSQVTAVVMLAAAVVVALSV